MFQFGFQSDIDGPFDAQRRWIKTGAAFVGLGEVLFGIYIPLALATWLVFNPQPTEPKTTQELVAGYTSLATILLGMYLVGAWCSFILLRWFTGERWSTGRVCRAIAGVSALAACTAGVSLWSNAWSAVFFCSFVASVAFFVLGAALVAIGQSIDHRYGSTPS